MSHVAFYVLYGDCYLLAGILKMLIKCRTHALQFKQRHNFAQVTTIQFLGNCACRTKNLIGSNRYDTVLLKICFINTVSVNVFVGKVLDVLNANV